MGTGTKQVRGVKIDEYVAAAEKLAKANGGVLRNLKAMGQDAIAKAIAKDTSGLFIPIIPKGKGKSIDEHVAAAEKLAKANGGVLPRNLKAKVRGSKISCPVCGVVVMQDKQGIQECSHLLAVFTTFDGEWLFDVGGIQKAVEKKAEEYEKDEGVINESVTNAFRSLYNGRDDMVLVIHNGGYIGGGIEVEETYLFARKAGTVAAMKACKTMKDREAKMSPKQLKALHKKRSDAAKKAWDTIRSKMK